MPRHLGRSDELPDEVPEGVGDDEDPGREVREKGGIINPLDSSDGGRDGIVHNEEVVHVGVASGLGGSVDLAPNHVRPIGGLQDVRLKVPVATDDEGAFETLNENGSMLKDEEVGFREALIDPEVYAEHINPAFAQTAHP